MSMQTELPAPERKLRRIADDEDRACLLFTQSSDHVLCNLPAMNRDWTLSNWPRTDLFRFLPFRIREQVEHRSLFSSSVAEFPEKKILFLRRLAG
jgi:hypothetical protein